jgi:hypothetical protein
LVIGPRKLFLPALLVFASASFVFSEGTRTWEQSKFEELSKGTSSGVAILSTGGLELAPAFRALTTTPSTYIWSIGADQAGNLYAATGSPARVYRITPDGKSTAIFEPQELQVQAIVLDPTGVIYAATNPDGKVYRIERSAAAGAARKSQEIEAGRKSGSATNEGPPKAISEFSASVYFDPKTKYIWDLVLDHAGTLYVATGDHGEIFRVNSKGEHSLFFKSDEAHIRVLALDGRGNLMAGSDGSGLIYRISPQGEAFVLYSAPKREITALAIDQSGNIYASAAGEKRGAPGNLFPGVISVAPIPSTPQPQPASVGSNPPPAPTPAPALAPFPTSGSTGGSEIYRIASDGSPTRIWNSREDLVYALAFDPGGRLLAGTGNRGHIFAVRGEDDYADLLKASASQITAFARTPGGALYVSTSNLGKIFVLEALPQSEGTYESDIFDAHIFSRWGRAEFRGFGNVELFARSGNVDNPDRNWSTWKKIDLQKDLEVGVPPARFVQWKAVLHAGNSVPRVDGVLLNYLPKNVAPDFDDVTVTVGVRYQALPKPTEVGGQSGNAPRFDAPPPPIRDRDSIGVKWAVHDDNDDQMVYSVYYRGDGESRWLLLKDNLTDKFYSFDASLLPDGGYTVKVVGSDAPSHSPDQALTSERESARFEVDTTPPQIANLTASVEGGEIHVSFRAADGFSTIKRAEYSVDAGNWQFLEPIGQLSDAKTEKYDFRMPVPADAKNASSKADTGRAGTESSSDPDPEHVVVVRVYDRYDNMSSAKAVIRGK